MEPPGGRDSRFNLGYGMNLLSGETAPDIYGGAPLRPSSSLQQLSPRGQCPQTARGPLKADLCYGEGGALGLEACHGVDGIADEAYGAMQPKKSPPSNGKKTKGRVKIKMEYIENKLRRYTTFSKRKTGIMKKAYELSTLTGTQVMLLVASETGHVYTFATRKLQPMITSEAGKALIQTCLNSPDPPGGSASGGDQRMSATGFEETELTYNISDEDSKEENMSGADSSGESSDAEIHEEDPLTPLPAPAAPKSATPPLASVSQAAPPSSSSSSTSTPPPAASKSSPVPPLLSPLIYQTPQGMMYAAPSNGGVIFSLAQPDPAAPGGRPQFITIPLSMVTTNGQGELDLSKRK